jgi:hypothetical protein
MVFLVSSLILSPFVIYTDLSTSYGVMSDAIETYIDMSTIYGGDENI